MENQGERYKMILKRATLLALTLGALGVMAEAEAEAEARIHFPSPFLSPQPIEASVVKAVEVAQVKERG